MRVFSDIWYSWRTLGASKSRTFLTMLGVIIGVMSVLAVSSIGLSAQELVVGQVTSLGSNLIAVVPGGGQETGPPPIAFGIVTTTVKVSDANALAAIPHVVAVTPYVQSVASVVSPSKTFNAAIVGVNDDYPRVEDVTIAEGRFFGLQEVGNVGRVVVLGYGSAEKLFPGGGAVGQTVRIKNNTYQVIGTLAKRGSAAFQNQDEQMFIPVTTAQKLVAGVDYVGFIRVKADASENIDPIREEIRKVLRRRHGSSDPAKDDFTVRSADQAASILGNVTGAVQGFLTIVTAISLVVGGINIMNVMFVAVRERTREIGLRKALGARPRRILIQFLIESSIISFMGGAIGAALGIGIAGIASVVVTNMGYDWTFMVSLPGVAWSLGTSLGIGIAFGVWPAMVAAKLEPIGALRFE